MADFAPPILLTLFLWWFCTGVIIYLDNLPPRTFGRSMFGATLVLGAALYGLTISGADASPNGAALGFGCAVLIWGWLEMAFLMGFLTGTRTEPSAPGSPFWRRFGDALAAILHHELSILVAGAAVIALNWGQPNQTGLFTFLILWSMRCSAKLNLFLGVRNLALDLLPAHLRFLRHFLNVRPMNLLFPFSVTLATTLAVLLARSAALADTGSFEQFSATILATLTTLAVLEHWFLVLPLPVEAMWRWSLRSRTRHEVAALQPVPVITDVSR